MNIGLWQLRPIKLGCIPGQRSHSTPNIRTLSKLFLIDATKQLWTERLSLSMIRAGRIFIGFNNFAVRLRASTISFFDLLICLGRDLTGFLLGQRRELWREFVKSKSRYGYRSRFGSPRTRCFPLYGNNNLGAL
jgi:hypothetical protein